MKIIIVVLLATFCVVEAAHLNYHRQDKRLNDAQPAVNFDKNF